MKICPKCGYQRTKSDDIIPDDECPKCGVIYAKANQESLRNRLPPKKPNNSPKEDESSVLSPGKQHHNNKDSIFLEWKNKIQIKYFNLHRRIRNLNAKINVTIVISIVIFVIISYNLLMTKTALEIIYSSEIESCHDGVYEQAKYSAEIISTNVSKSSLNSPLYIKGRAKLQNGFGAWTQYEYACFASKGDSDVYALMTKGWD